MTQHLFDCNTCLNTVGTMREQVVSPFDHFVSPALAPDSSCASNEIGAYTSSHLLLSFQFLYRLVQSSPRLVCL